MATEIEKLSSPAAGGESEVHGHGLTTELPMAERLAALTYEQVHLIDLLTQGRGPAEIAELREAEEPEINAVISDTLGILGVESTHKAAYLLLNEGLIDIDDEERRLARERVEALSPHQRTALQVFMPGPSYKEAAHRLDINARTTYTYAYAINRKLGTGSMVASARVGFAASLAADGRERRKVSSISRPNALEFLRWRHPAASEAILEEFSDPELGEVLVLMGEQTDAQIAELAKAKQEDKARALARAFEAVQSWFEGQTIPQIAEAQGRMEGQVHVGLSSYAAKSADRYGPEGLRETVSERLSARAAAELDEIQDPEESETAGEAIISIRDEIRADKSEALNQDYSRDFETPENFEPEVVSLLNVRREEVHEYEVLEAFFGRHFSLEQHQLVITTLGDIASKGAIFDEDGGYYSIRAETRPVIGIDDDYSYQLEK